MTQTHKVLMQIQPNKIIQEPPSIIITCVLITKKKKIIFIFNDFGMLYKTYLSCTISIKTGIENEHRYKITFKENYLPYINNISIATKIRLLKVFKIL